MKKSIFQSWVDSAFLGLESKYGFKKTEMKFVDRSVTVRYRNTTTELCLNYEIGDSPWLEISDVQHADNKTTLSWLLVEKGEQKMPTAAQAFRPTPLDEDKLGAALQKIGQQVTEYGADLLRGDFTILPKLKERAEKYDAECKRYLATHKSKA